MVFRGLWNNVRCMIFVLPGPVHQVSCVKYTNQRPAGTYYPQRLARTENRVRPPLVNRERHYRSSMARCDRARKVITAGGG